MKLLHILVLLVFSFGAQAQSLFTDAVYTDKKHFDNELSWSMNLAIANPDIYGFKGLCEKRSRDAQTRVDGSYVVGMYLKKHKQIAGKRDHAVLCKDGQCVDSTGVLSDVHTLIPENELEYFAWDIHRI